MGSAKAPAMTNVSHGRPRPLSMRDGTTATRDPNSSHSGSMIGSEITRKYSLPLSSNCKTINY